MAKKASKRVPSRLYWCHELALRTLNCLDQVAGQFEPDNVRRLKDIDGTPIATRKVQNAGKPIAYLRDEYLSWSEYEETIQRFDCTQRTPIEVCGIIAPSAHALLYQLVRRVLNRAWNKITPRRDRLLRTPEEDLWPEARRLAEADLDQMADAVLIYTREREKDGPIDADCIQWLEAALQQEYARAIRKLSRPSTKKQDLPPTPRFKPGPCPQCKKKNTVRVATSPKGKGYRRLKCQACHHTWKSTRNLV